MDLMNRREEVFRKRISKAWFLYAYIELTQRQGRNVAIKGDLESTILDNIPSMRRSYGYSWSSHLCDVKGCESTLVLDGGMKPHRSVCADTLSGVTEYQVTGTKVVTGDNFFINFC